MGAPEALAHPVVLEAKGEHLVERVARGGNGAEQQEAARAEDAAGFGERTVRTEGFGADSAVTSELGADRRGRSDAGGDAPEPERRRTVAETSSTRRASAE